VYDSNSTSTSHPKSTTQSLKHREAGVPHVAESPNQESGWLLITITEPEWLGGFSTTYVIEGSSVRAVMK
jgi:hypothetical protein